MTNPSEYDEDPEATQAGDPYQQDLKNVTEEELQAALAAEAKSNEVDVTGWACATAQRADAQLMLHKLYKLGLSIEQVNEIGLQTFSLIESRSPATESKTIEYLKKALSSHGITVDDTKIHDIFEQAHQAVFACTTSATASPQR
jgi:hypothetical protein